MFVQTWRKSPNTHSYSHYVQKRFLLHYISFPSSFSLILKLYLNLYLYYLRLLNSWSAARCRGPHWLFWPSQFVNRLTSTLIPPTSLSDEGATQRASNGGNQTRHLCRDHQRVWHYVNSTYPVLNASAAKMSILNVKEAQFVAFKFSPGRCAWDRPWHSKALLLPSATCVVLLGNFNSW